jgi:hypothetical protein
MTTHPQNAAPSTFPIAFFDGSIAPEVKRGHYDDFVITIENDKGRRSTYAAYYLNAYPLDYGDDCKCTTDKDHDDGCPTTGWFYDESNFEYEHCYHAVNGKVITWAKIPTSDEVATALTAPETARGPTPWCFDMEAAPKCRNILVVDCEVVSEAYYDDDDGNWWLAQTGPHDFDACRPIYPTAWMEKPAPPPRPVEG